MKPMSQAPLASPITQRDGSLNEAWRKYELMRSTYLERATTPKTITSLDKPNEVLTYVESGAVYLYDYTGKGGCTFSLNGTKLTLPATPESQNVKSFVIITGA